MHMNFDDIESMQPRDVEKSIEISLEEIDTGTQDESRLHRGGMMAKEGRNSIEETIIETPLSEHELESLLVGFLEALEREQRLGLTPVVPKKEDDVRGESA